MKEISLNILDIAENSVKARATLTEITVNETDDTLTLKISDNGCGMTGRNAESRNRPVLHHAHHAQGGNGAAAFKNGGRADGRPPSIFHLKPKANTPKTTEPKSRRFSIKSILIIRRSAMLFQVL